MELKDLNNKPLKFNIITDIHYFSQKLGVAGKAYKRADAASQMLLKDSSVVIASALKQICNDNFSNIILISGDTTHNGDYDSHKEIIKMLTDLKKSGMRIYCITATHDYQDDGITYSYKNDIKTEIPAAERDELLKMYYDLGFSEAIAIHNESMSYVVQLEEGYRLFALNDDKNGSGKSGFSESCFDWIKKQAIIAKKENQQIIAMTHHPMLSPSPLYKIIGKNDMMGDCEKRVEDFSKLGINIVFTGHSHIHDISFAECGKNKAFYDISTASLIGYPALYREVSFYNDTVDIKSKEIHMDTDIKFNGKNFKEHIYNQFFGMIENFIKSSAGNRETFADMASAISIDKKIIYRYGWLIKPAAVFVNRLKIGTVAKWTAKETGLKKADYKRIKDKRVVDFVLSLAMYLYSGNSPYTPDTAEYKITVGFADIIDSFFNAAHIKIGKLLKAENSVCNVIEPLLYNKGIDDCNALINLNESFNELDSKYKNKYTENKKGSKKGLGILLIIIALCIILIPFLPLILTALLFGYLFNYIKYHNKFKNRDEKNA